MNLDQLGASFEHNRTAILGTAAAGVVAFALYKKKQAASAPTAAAQGVATAPAYSAGGQAAGMYGAGGYDSSASDMYGLVQPQMEALGQQVNDLSSKLNAVPVSAAPPVASALLSPSYNGNYFHMGSGLGEVESDGSLFVFSPSQWQQATSQNPNAPAQVVDFGPANLPNVPLYSTAGNVQAKAAPAASK